MVLNKDNVDAAFASVFRILVANDRGDVNESKIEFAQLAGTFNWHHHENEDELFLVVKGTLRMKLHP